jgi:CheY-like chemotaxis protein
VARADELRRQQVLQRRFEAMGLEASLLPGGRAVVVTLPVGPEPFETPQGARRLRAVRFYTVGHDRIKCVAPRALFHLPFVRILDCASPADLEARIRAAWAERLRGLARAKRWLDDLGVTPEAALGAPQWSFSLGLEDSRARGLAVEAGRVILPSRGPLSGLVLGRAEDRVFQVDASCAAAVDLELAATSRLEELARAARRPATRFRHVDDLPAPRIARQTPVLLVGARLSVDRSLHDSLRLRGFAIEASRSLGDAIDAFRERSFELVLAEARLDRGDGLELIPALRTLPGILELPVALIDDRPRDIRRSAAAAAGAAAYWTGPLESEQAADALAQIAAAARRRFVRFPHALSVSWDGCSEPGVTASVGRGGMFLKTGDLPLPRRRYALHLADADATLRVDAESVYRLPEAGIGPEGVGLRFCGFETGAERTWIDYLARLLPASAGSGAARALQ